MVHLPDVDAGMTDTQFTGGTIGHLKRLDQASAYRAGTGQPFQKIILLTVIFRSITASRSRIFASTPPLLSSSFWSFRYRLFASWQFPCKHVFLEIGSISRRGPTTTLIFSFFISLGKSKITLPSLMPLSCFLSTNRFFHQKHIPWLLAGPGLRAPPC